MEGERVKVSKRGCLMGVAGVLAGAVVAGLAGAWYVDRQYHAVLAGPVVDHLTLTDLKPSLRAVIDPGPMSDVLREQINAVLPREAPGWLVDALLPHGASLIMGLAEDGEEVGVHFLLNARRLDSLIAENFNLAEVPGRFPEIQWSSEGMKAESRGALTLTGSFAVDASAQEEAFYRWRRTLVETPVALEGGHLLEAVADNREGGAYVVVASLMKLYDYDLEAEAEDVSLASFQFVTQARLTVDRVGDDALHMRLAMPVIEEFKDRVAVLNLRAFLDDVLQQGTEDFERYHGMRFVGESRWEGSTMVFEYELGEMRKLIELIAEGRLFVEEADAR